ncbi:NAD(P)/FAD-dependent oxidoreductase [Candidatus Methylacidithermus pantelleriae]|uniref:NADH dehydrogenase n=1 Tax=Candidatus Methylacidithermus pantelleriae TaxID=2744239 RepID=A0A8J2BL02_9BACT|nr:NAD(P)/FAD-dependent oxidoreductase [Candidatus Methylacidithermus pantelleriae]CAF0691543.1 NADH dehydrogenase [Candidatus Methylacidithermus pantelleriae]
MPGEARIIIAGAGFGGLAATRILARAHQKVTLVDQANYHLFQPLLYQVATAGLAATEIAIPVRSIFRRYPWVEARMDTVVGVELDAKRLLLSGGYLEFDFLILALGAVTNYFDHPEWEAYALSLKSLEDAIEIRSRILSALEKAEYEKDAAKRAALLTIVIVGGGATGVEMAGAVAELTRHALRGEFRHIDPARTRIVLLEAGPRILPTLPPDLSSKAQEFLQQLGVEVRLRSPVTALGEGWIEIGAQRIAAGTILWTAGVKANPLGKAFGLPVEPNGRVLVNPDLSVPGYPYLFVIGDLAAVRDASGKLIPQVAPAAIQMGEHAARTILAELEEKNTLRKPFRYIDKGTLATVGRSMAVAKIGWIQCAGWIAWILWLFVHLIKLIGFHNKALVLFEWTWSYLTFRKGARVILRYHRPSRADSAGKAS